MISLTGSVDTGKWIAAHAAPTLKRVHLELGGKAPVVVFDDVAIDAALETIAGTGYYNAGQDCTAATRVLAGSKVYDDVVGGLAAQAKELVVGDTLAPDTTLGPLNSARQRGRVEGFLERRPGHAEVITGGSEPDRPGFFLEPTVVAGLQQDDEMIQREIFATWAGRCGSPTPCASGACGSMTTSRWPPRCPTGASTSRATARTCRCTHSRTTRRSST
jgi:betaine-aldehyde dehydrogenase